MVHRVGNVLMGIGRRRGKDAPAALLFPRLSL